MSKARVIGSGGLLLMAVMTFDVAAAGTVPQSDRSPIPPASLNIVEGWRFCPAEADKGTEQGWFSEAWDDSAWAVVAAARPLERQGHDATDAAWYRKRIRIPVGWRGHRVLSELWGGTEGGGALYLNGRLHAEVALYGNVFDLSSSLRFGEENLFAIRYVDRKKREGFRRGPLTLLIDDPPIPVGLDRSFPVKGSPVSVTIYGAGDKPARELEVTDPAGVVSMLRLNPEAGDGDSRATWTPARCGQHRLRAGHRELVVWVVRSPVFFHWWNSAFFPKYATDVKVDFEARPGRVGAWHKRGVATVSWAGGESMHRESHGDKRFTRPEHWLTSWTDAVNRRRGCQGIALDEICLMQREPEFSIVQALEDYVAQRPDDRIGIYCAGAHEDSGEVGEAVRRSGGVIMIESYWGDRDIYEKRWHRMSKAAGPERTVFALSGGYVGAGNKTPKAVGDLRKEVTWIRQMAPRSPGLALFNAYSRPDIDAVTDAVIEDLFLKPVLHLRCEGGSIVAWNIGNADAVGCALRFLDGASREVGRIAVPTLAAGETFRADVPAGAVTVEELVPDGMARLYDGFPCAAATSASTPAPANDAKSH